MQDETPKIYIGHLLSSVLSSLKLTAYMDTLEVSTPQPQFGDYSTNAPLVLAKKLKQNPKAVAETLIGELAKMDAGKKLARAEEKGGFINFFLTSDSLAQTVTEFTKNISVPPTGCGRKVLFEYSSPNTNKPLHIGHTRNDVYGLACIRLLQAIGHEVVACEIVNDRGIHIMKSMLMYRQYGSGQTPQSAQLKPDHFVGKFYSMFAEKSAESPEKETELLEQAQELLQQWEAGEPQVRALWKQMNDWWYEGVRQTYEKEGSYFDEVDRESEIYNQGRDIVLRGVEQGVFRREDDGSVSADLTGEGLDKKYLLRKDGTTIYVTQDLYLWHMRNLRHHPEITIVTTAIEQAYHFAVLGKLFRLLKFPWAESFRHLPYEHVYFGKDKMSSRAGKSITADDLVVAIKRTVTEAMARLQRTKQNSGNEVLVEQVAFAAIKYGYLKYDPNTRIYFDIDQTISLEGNTGPYIQYAYSRIQSILKKAGEFDIMKPYNLVAPAEISLARKLIHYPESIQHAAAEYKPNLLCNYLHELASEFNTFYNEVPVLASEDLALKNQRLTLLTATANILKHGLHLLGIEAPKEM